MSDAEITRLTAEQIMGYRSCDDGKTWAVGDYRVDHSVKFDPLSDDRDACAVLDKMASEDFTIAILFKAAPQEWWATFQNEEKYWTPGEFPGRSKNRNRAIVLAALKAKGVDVG